MISYLLSFFLIVNIFITIFYLFTKPTYWAKYIVFSLYCVLVNFAILVQSMYMDIRIYNIMFSAVLYIIFSLQPIIYSYIGLLSYSNHTYTKLTAWSILLFFTNMADINMKLMTMDSSIYGCSGIKIYTRETMNGYYSWTFSVCNITGYSMFDILTIILSLVSFLFYKKNMTPIWKGLIFSGMITILLFSPSKHEFTYMFMVSYVFANIYVALKSK